MTFDGPFRPSWIRSGGLTIVSYHEWLSADICWHYRSRFLNMFSRSVFYCYFVCRYFSVRYCLVHCFGVTSWCVIRTNYIYVFRRYSHYDFIDLRNRQTKLNAIVYPFVYYRYMRKLVKVQFSFTPILLENFSYFYFVFCIIVFVWRM